MSSNSFRLSSLKPSCSKVVHFVNDDLIASGLSPLQPELAAIKAGRLLLNEIDCLAASCLHFAFESTLSGRLRATSRGNGVRQISRRVDPEVHPARVELQPPPTDTR